jgi:apolipoprotein N-acyltransferase
VITAVTVLQQLSGWRGHVVLYLTGLTGALAMPPLGWWPVFALVFPVALIRFGTVTDLRSAFGQGWLFGFGYFCGVLHWIGFAFLVEADTYLWMMPFAVGGLAAVMAIYWGLATAAAVSLRRFRFPLWLSFPPCLAVAELLRGLLMTGFPWAVPGLATDGMGPVLQLASIVGMPGLTLLVLLWSCAVFAAVTQTRRERMTAWSLLALLPLSAVYGWARLGQNTGTVPDVGLRIVQPNISQEDKWRQDNSAKIFDELVAATVAPSVSGLKVTHVIWPESAVPFLIDESEGAKNVLRGALAGEVHLITGAIRRAKAEPSADHFTSVLVFDPYADVIGVYDKWRLVPGGEFLPFAWALEPLGFQQLVHLPGSFAAGSGPETIDIPGAGPAGVIICYEAIFPDRLVDPEQRPQWIINVTNDGWFGKSTGPYQHLAQTRMRAVEQGLPIARSANTGVSAMIDPYGRIIASLPLGAKDALDVRLPKSLSAPIYARIGHLGFAIMMVLSGVLLLFSRKD